MALGLSAVGLVAAAALTRGKNFGNNTETQSQPEAKKTEPQLKLGENLILGAKMEPNATLINPDNTPYLSPDYWRFAPDGKHIQIITDPQQRAHSGAYPVQVEGYYDQNGLYQKPFLETMNPIWIDLIDGYSEYKLSFRSKVSSVRNEPLVHVVAVEPSPNAAEIYRETKHLIPFQPKVKQLGTWSPQDDPYEFFINLGNFPPGHGIILKFTIGDTDNNTFDKNNRGYVQYADLSLTKVENPLEGKPSTSI